MDIREFLESPKGENFKKQLKEDRIAFVDQDPKGDKLGYLSAREPNEIAIKYTADRKLKTIIICPAILKQHWKRKIDNLTNQETGFVSDLSYKPKSYLIVSYEELSSYYSSLEKDQFDCVIVDQAHFLRNTKSNRSKAVNKLFSKTERKILLSDTPIVNKLDDLTSQLKFLRKDILT